MKFALLCAGNEESYGLLFTGSELSSLNQEIKYFDTEQDSRVVDEIMAWSPDFICFSPMIAFFDKLLNICRQIKKENHKIISVFGGIYVFTNPNIIEDPYVDVVVIGPVRGSIQRILNGEKGIIRTELTLPEDMPFPYRKKYYEDIPRIRDRYRKFIVSLQGCYHNCSYCNSSSYLRIKEFGSDNFKRYFLHRRPVDVMIEEVRDIIRYGQTYEIQWCDDDVFSGYNMENWLMEFSKKWQEEFRLKAYIQASTQSCLSVPDEVLLEVSKITDCVGIGIEAIRPFSLKLFNRQWDNEEKMKKAYDRLKSFGLSVNMQAIVGLPVEDPVEEALDTIMGMQRIGAGSICSVYPLQILPHSQIEKYCKENGFLFHDTNIKETNTGIVDIKFDSLTSKRLKNICKLGTMFVKYNINEDWMRALIDLDFDDYTSKKLSEIRYKECLMDRIKNDGDKIFEEVIKVTNLRY
jgi:radical SAM superfamily enzyme YgiQ (UPF0313 family)